MKFWRSREFLDLQREWDEKLKVSGFRDEECNVGTKRVLRQRVDHVYRLAEAPEVREAKEQYFRIMSQHAASESFANPTDRVIMIHVAEGAEPVEIVARLKAIGVIMERRTVAFIRRRYENKWGVIRWTLKKMRLRHPIK